MGKKNKKTLKNLEEGITSCSNSAKKRKANHEGEVLKQNITISDTPHKIKKIKKNTILSNNTEATSHIHETQERTAESSIIENNKISAETVITNSKEIALNMKNKNSKRNTESQTSINKKIVFNDDDVEGGNVVKETVKTNLKFLQGEEAEVTEEDIDAFCEGISEEDNVQYEKWVKLFEAQFSSSKNKKKCNKTHKT